LDKPPGSLKVAIDGPAGAGKSTVARRVAAQLGLIYVDTGAMYRAVTWYVLERGVQATDRSSVAALTDELDIRLALSADGQRVIVNGQDVTGELRTPEVTGAVSEIAKIPEVRRRLTALQRSIAAGGGVVMDGRDIGTKVMPDAELKIYLTASVEERARRRCEELKAAGIPVDMERLVREIRERDRTDEEREEAPLRKADDAVLIDSTALSIEEVVERIVRLAESKASKASNAGKAKGS